jgi:hypothetical protein
MGVALVQVFAHHRGVVQGEFAIDQGRQGVVRVQIEQILRRLGRIDHD